LPGTKGKAGSRLATLLFMSFQPDPALTKDAFPFVPPKGADVVGA